MRKPRLKAGDCRYDKALWSGADENAFKLDQRADWASTIHVCPLSQLWHFPAVFAMSFFRSGRQLHIMFER